MPIGKRHAAWTAAFALVACADEGEWTENVEAPYVVDRDPPLGQNPEIEYRAGGRNQCSTSIGEEEARAALVASPNVAVASIRVLEECSSVGGNHVFASTERVLRGRRASAVQSGGHGCPPFTVGESRPYVSFEAHAVIGYRTTPKEEMDGGSGWCVPSYRDGTIDVMVIFDTKRKAEAFAATIE